MTKKEMAALRSMADDWLEASWRDGLSSAEASAFCAMDIYRFIVEQLGGLDEVADADPASSGSAG